MGMSYVFASRRASPESLIWEEANQPGLVRLVSMGHPKTLVNLVLRSRYGTIDISCLVHPVQSGSYPSLGSLRSMVYLFGALIYTKILVGELQLY